MAERGENGLLPEGLRDALPPEAAHEDALMRKLVDIFMRHGYERVSPPLVEFEDSLLARIDAANRLDMFRLLDPDSQRVMALRSDLTGQVARIAETRLGHAPRPLRLSYAGTALRVKGSQLRPERQIRQAGVELIGPTGEAAALEILLLAYESLAAVGVGDVSIDLAMPGFVPVLGGELGLDPKVIEKIREALDTKNIGGLPPLDAKPKKLFSAVLAAAGDIEQASQRLAALELPPKSATLRDQLLALVKKLQSAAPALALTIDLGERRGFSYQGELGFTIYAPQVRGELGRGGRYAIRRSQRGVEPATGFTLYLNSVSEAVPTLPAPKRVFVAADTPRDDMRRLQAEGWVTVAALTKDIDLKDEARRLNCSHVFRAGKIETVK